MLDTCVVQNLEWVYDRQQENSWSEEDAHQLKDRYGSHANELISLWKLVDQFECRSTSPPWLVSAGSLAELSDHPGTKRTGLMDGWKYWQESSDDWSPDSFGPIAPGLLSAAQYPPNRLILRGLGVSEYGEVIADDGPLAAFPDVGDRKLIREALFASAPAILTTDIKTLWSRRAAVQDMGLEIWRPTDLLDFYEAEWYKPEP